MSLRKCLFSLFLPAIIITSVNAFEVGKYTKRNTYGVEICQVTISDNEGSLLIEGFTEGKSHPFSSKRPLFSSDYSLNVIEDSTDRLTIRQSYSQRRGGALCEYCPNLNIISDFDIQENDFGSYDLSFVQIRNGQEFAQLCQGLKKSALN